MKGRQKLWPLAGLIIIAVTLLLFFLPGESGGDGGLGLSHFLPPGRGGALRRRHPGGPDGRGVRGDLFPGRRVYGAVYLLHCLLAVSLVSILWMRPGGGRGCSNRAVCGGLDFTAGPLRLRAGAGAAQAAEEQALSALKALEGRVRTLAGAPANRDYAAPLEPWRRPYGLPTAPARPRWTVSSPIS